MSEILDCLKPGHLRLVSENQTCLNSKHLQLTKVSDFRKFWNSDRWISDSWKSLVPYC